MSPQMVNADPLVVKYYFTLTTPNHCLGGRDYIYSNFRQD